MTDYRAKMKQSVAELVTPATSVDGVDLHRKLEGRQGVRIFVHLDGRPIKEYQQQVSQSAGYICDVFNGDGNSFLRQPKPSFIQRIYNSIRHYEDPLTQKLDLSRLVSPTGLEKEVFARNSGTNPGTVMIYHTPAGIKLYVVKQVSKTLKFTDGFEPDGDKGYNNLWEITQEIALKGDVGFLQTSKKGAIIVPKIDGNTEEQVQIIGQAQIEWNQGNVWSQWDNIQDLLMEMRIKEEELRLQWE